MEEFKRLLRIVGGNMSEEEAYEMFSKVDLDGNKSLDFKEFVSLWNIIRGNIEVERFKILF